MSNHIQIPDTPPCIFYVGNGSQAEFSYPFPLFDAAHLHVHFNGVLQATGFAVLHVGESTGGSVLFNTAPAFGVKIALQRLVPLQRISDFIEGGELSANALNNEFDYLTVAAQQLQNDQRYTISFPGTETLPDAVLPAKATRANKAVGFDGNGNLQMLETAKTYAAPSMTQSGPGAVPRSLVDKMRETVSAKDYGAAGDGLTNDFDALTQALAAQAHVILPPGTYLINAPLEIGSGKILQGSGAATIIKASNNTFDTLCLIVSDAVLRDLTIDGGDTGLRLYGKAGSCRLNIAENITLKNQAVGIELDGYIDTNNPCEANILRDITIEKPAQYGVIVTRSGLGKHPAANKFSSLRVVSLGTALTGAAYFIEAGKDYNSLTACDAVISGASQACIRIGPAAEKTSLLNITTSSDTAAPGVLLDSGSLDTALMNLSHAGSGAVIQDNSGGNYMTLSAGVIEKNRLNRTRIRDLTIEQQRFSFETVALASAGVVTIDLSKTTYLVSAPNGQATLQLPKAAAANSGAVVTVIRTDASIHYVLITENTGSGPDGRTQRLGALHDTMSVISDGTVWRILSTNILSGNSISIDTGSGYIPDVTRQLHLVSAASGIITVELPAATAPISNGRVLTIKKTDATANAVRIIEAGLAGPDNAIVNLTTRYSAITVMSNGVNWHIIAKV